MPGSQPPRAEAFGAAAPSFEARTVLPAAVAPFVGFAQLLPKHGFAVVSDQTVAFLRSIVLLGPRSLSDIYWAARATLAPSADRLAEFDALFEEAFGDEADVLAFAESSTEKERSVTEGGAADLEPIVADRANESGKTASAAEALAVKSFAPVAADRHLAAMQKHLAKHAPRRRGFRRIKARRGDRLDFRRSLAGMVRGEAGSAKPLWTRRREQPRRMLLLIDISGSMKAHTADYLRFAHALTQSLPAVETFSFGTRLTRLTRSLRHKDLARALAEIAPAVADWSGGTRIGESLSAFLAVPRFSRASRSALAIVLSDGLERGDVAMMASAVRRLAARSWRLAWLTPLAADPAFSPETAGLRAILPVIDHLGDGSSIAALCAFIAGSAGLAAAPPSPGRAGETGHGPAHHRRPPSHLAAKGRALARRADAAAHLRAL